MRLVEESDAEFILSLRMDKRYNKYLSKVKPDLQAQKNWIVNYKDDEKTRTQFYFIIERIDGTPCGTVRIYDLRKNSFCWGSWVLNQDKTHYAAIESAFLVYQFGFGKLGYRKSHFDVRKENVSVIKFHKRLGAEITDEDKDNIYFEITQSVINGAKKAFLGKIP